MGFVRSVEGKAPPLLMLPLISAELPGGGSVGAARAGKGAVGDTIDGAESLPCAPEFGFYPEAGGEDRGL